MMRQELLCSYRFLSIDHGLQTRSAVLTCPGQGPRPATADAAIAYYSSSINKLTWVVNKETHETFDLKIIIYKYITML